MENLTGQPDERVSFAENSALVLVPAYNAAKYLPELIQRLRQFVCDDNLLFVNDGSTDNTLDLLKEHRVKFISFPQNRGKGAALMAGFDFAIERNYRSVLTIDADLQHLPEEIPRFYALDNGRRMVIGTRNIDLSIMPFARWLTNNLTSLIISVFVAFTQFSRVAIIVLVLSRTRKSPGFSMTIWLKAGKPLFFAQTMAGFRSRS